jgi:hypothetical protein
MFNLNHCFYYNIYVVILITTCKPDPVSDVYVFFSFFFFNFKSKDLFKCQKKNGYLRVTLSKQHAWMGNTFGYLRAQVNNGKACMPGLILKFLV